MNIFMRKIYRNIGIVLGILVMMACTEEPFQEGSSFIPENPDPDAEKLPPNEQWAWVGTYPGEVNNSIPRLQGEEVKIRGNYTVKDLKLTFEPGYLQSSGLYVPPAEEVTIHFPGGADNLHYQVGIAKWELEAGISYSRLEKVYAEGKLEPGTNRIYTNFGGNLYLYFDGAPQAAEIAVTVDGAVRSADYVLDKTNLGQWREIVSDSVNPMIWGELIGKRIIMTLPVNILKKIERPDALLKFYDELLDTDLSYFGAVGNEELPMPWRIYADVQLPAVTPGVTSKMYSYYPMGFVYNSTDSLGNALVDLPNLNATNSDKILLQGLASLYSMNWSSGIYLGPVLDEIASWHLYQRKGKWGDLVTSMETPKSLEKRYKLQSDAEKKSMVIQLLQEYGWNLLTYIAGKCRTEIPAEVPGQYKNDLLAIYSSEFGGADLTGFFESWGYPVSIYARNYMKQYPVPQYKFWEKVSTVNTPAEGTVAVGTAYPKNIPLQDTVYVPQDWTGEVSSLAGGDGAGKLIDGKVNTHWHSDYNDASKTYPHWFQFEFPEPITFNYVYMIQRNHDNPGPKTFEILVKKQADGEYEEVEEGRKFYLCRDYSAAGPVQKSFLNEVVTAYGIKIMLIEGLERNEGQGNRQNYVALAEFGIGLLQ